LNLSNIHHIIYIQPGDLTLWHVVEQNFSHPTSPAEEPDHLGNVVIDEFRVIFSFSEVLSWIGMFPELCHHKQQLNGNWLAGKI